MKNKFKTSVICLAAVIAVILNTTGFNVVFASDLVKNVTVNGNSIKVSGKSDVGNEQINIFLLNDETSVSELNAANTNAKFTQTVNYCNTITSNGNGDFSDSFKINNMQGNGQYLLYVKSGSKSYTQHIETVKHYYVSKTGNDSTGDGTSENPYATITKARDVLRNKPRTLPVEVVIGEGVYNISDKIEFKSGDSGTEEFPITYRAANDSKVVITGTTRIDTSDIPIVTDPTITARLREKAVGKVVEIDLRANGISHDVVDFLSHHAITANGKPMGVYLNDNPQTIARWPNAGYEIITSVVSPGGNQNDGTQSQGGAVIKINNAGKGRTTNWTTATNMYVEGYLGKDYHGEWAKVAGVDPGTTNITLDTYTRYGVAKGMRIAVVNLIEEIDVPGEWYADPDTMKMYYYPPHPLTSKDNLEIATLCDDFIKTGYNTKYINFEGLEFAKNADSPAVSQDDNSAGNGINIDGDSSNINIRNCVFRNIGIDAIRVYGSDVNIDGCIIYNTGFSGIYVNSGNRKTLTSRNITISNCIISKVNRDTGSNNRAGITLDDRCVGINITNNIFSNIPNSAIRYKGNNHMIKNNEIYNTVTEAADAGAIYAGRNWTQYGTVIQNNYFHDIGGGLESESAAAVFWDDWHSGNTFVGNVVDMKNLAHTAGITIGGGRDNTVSENIFVNSVIGVNGKRRSFTITSDWYKSDPFQTFKEATDGVDDAETIDYNNDWLEAFRISYPSIRINFQDTKRYKAYNRVETVKNNVEYNCTTAWNIPTEMSNTAGTVVSGNRTAAESDFVDASKGDYRIKSSRKSALGMNEYAPDENTVIGLQSDHAIDPIVAEFDLVAPADNARIEGGSTVLVWGESILADSYIYEIASDRGFTDIVKSGTVTGTQVSVSGLAGPEYFWRVKAVNNSAQIGSQYMCNKVFRFTTIGDLSFSDISYDNTKDEVSCTATNSKSDTAESFIVIVAIRTDDDRITAIRTIDKTVQPNTAQAFSISTAFENNPTGSVVEFYIWDSLSDVHNLIDKVSFDR